MSVSSVVASLKALVLRLRIIIIIILILLCAGIVVGAAYGWTHYKNRQNPEHAVEIIKKNLLPPNIPKLITHIDFRPLAEDMAKRLLDVHPQLQASASTPDITIAHLTDNIQQILKHALNTADKTQQDTSPKLPAHAPLHPLPDTFIAQLATKLSIQSRQDDRVFLRADIEYPRAERTFPLILLMEKKSTTHPWMITRLVNTAELAHMFADAQAALQKQRDDAVAEKNALELRRMNAQVRFTSCTVRAHMLSDHNSGLLVIEVLGYNTGEHTIHNANFLVSIRGNTIQDQRHVNMARRIAPGDTFHNTWTIDMDKDNPQDMALLQNPPLHCDVSPHAMTLSTGELLYIRLTPQQNP